MDLQIKGKTAFISGSTKGIGFATALGLAKEGVSVWINGRSDDSVNVAIKRIQDEVPNADVSGIAADLSHAQGCNEIISALPSVDILVNNLGIFEPKPFEEIPDEDWTRFFETNVMQQLNIHTKKPQLV